MSFKFWINSKEGVENRIDYVKLPLNIFFSEIVSFLYFILKNAFDRLYPIFFSSYLSYLVIYKPALYWKSRSFKEETVNIDLRNDIF